MSQRLQVLSNQIRSIPAYYDSSFDYFDAASHLTKQENEARLKIRRFVQTEVTPHIHQYVEEAKFPEYLIPKLKQLNPLEYFLEKPYGNPLSTVARGMIIAELARGDAGVCTAIIVHYGLLGYTIEALGSEQQKEYYLPKIKNFEILGGWGLTQEKVGSDASNLQTTVTKIDIDTYKINGNKRWIGNGNRDILIIWAKNTDSKKVQGFIVDNSSPGLVSQPIKNKLAMRVVQNCHITLHNVLVKEDRKLPKAKDFSSGTNVVLKHSRVYVCWVAVGIALGVYDNVIKYASHRKQFGGPITSYQLVQQKIVKIMSHTQAVLQICIQLAKLVDEGKATIGRIAMVKAYVSATVRDIARWGRQIYGGNGIIHDNYAMKALADAQAVYTYEGSYEVNTLVCGRQLTGVSAFSQKKP